MPATNTVSLRGDKALGNAMRNLIIPLVAMVAGLANGNELAPVSALEIEGAIIPAATVQGWHDSIRKGRGKPHGIQNMLGIAVDSFWTPTKDDVATLESRLPDAIKRAVVSPQQYDKFATTKEAKEFISKNAKAIVQNFRRFRRQYIGLVVEGKKYIYVNSFPKDEFHNDNTSDFVFVLDGGFWYWQILYNAKQKKFSDLNINGDA